MSTYTAPEPPPSLNLLEALPDDTVVISGTPAVAVPMRPPPGAWGLLVRAVVLPSLTRPALRVADASAPAEHEPAAAVDVLAGAWLAQQPSAALHTGDVVLLLEAPSNGSQKHVAVELQIASEGAWRLHKAWSICSDYWPRLVAPAVQALMSDATNAMLARARETQMAPISRLLMDGGLGFGPRRPLPAPDALSELITAGLVRVGTRLSCGPYDATVAAGGVLVSGQLVPGPLRGLSTVSSRASALAGYPVNGWDLWQLPDGRRLNELRIALAAGQ